MSWKEHKYIKKVRSIEDLCITCKEDMYEGSGAKKASSKGSQES